MSLAIAFWKIILANWTFDEIEALEGWAQSIEHT